MYAFRICDDRYPVLDVTGSTQNGGRWNSKGNAVIYAAETYSLSLLETLVHTGFRKLPGGRHYSRIIIPDSASIESFVPADYLGWDLDDNVVSRAFGDQWIKKKRSLVLRVPSAVTRGPEWNTVINPLHPEYPLIKADSAQAVYWDARLVKN
jgi:RES domain-containing protein